MMVRGIRGAINVPANTEDAIIEATHKLFKEIIFRNSISTEQIASIILSATTDLDATFPAKAIRSMGLTSIPLMCAQEINVPGAMSQVIRVLIHINTDKKQSEIIHCYLNKAAELRPDIEGDQK